MGMMYRNVTAHSPLRSIMLRSAGPKRSVFLPLASVPLNLLFPFTRPTFNRLAASSSACKNAPCSAREHATRHETSSATYPHIYRSIAPATNYRLDLLSYPIRLNRR